MGKESIKVSDFIAEIVKVYNLDSNDFKPTTLTAYKCSKCGRGYNADDKFCSDDGKPVIKYQYDVLSEETKHNIIRVFFDFDTLCDEDEDFSYTYIDSVEKRGDGSGYWMNYIFQRKSDDKYFVYTSYDGRIEEDTLDETSKEVTTVWEFEKYFD